jgi:serine/threonine-protein kinase
MPIQRESSRDLLFGLIALQVGLIDQAKLVAGFQAWTIDRSRSLAEHLIGQGHLDAERRAAIEAMVAVHLKVHGDDVERSIASLNVGRVTWERLQGLLAAHDENSTISHVGTDEIPVDDDQTARHRPVGATSPGHQGAMTSAGHRFRALRPHARGGLGEVFVALDSELDREVALKQILEQYADNPESRQRFVLEAEITGGLEHPGIVPVYGLGAYADGRPYYAMRFIRGDSLRDAIAAFHKVPAAAGHDGRKRSALADPAKTVAFRNLLRRFLDVCNAMEYAHARGVLHRDLKPGNIIVGKYGETLVVDWGLAKATGKSGPTSEDRTLAPASASGSSETVPGRALGTPAYMSPEQARGDLAAMGPRSDVYSLGATLYCLLTGRPPFERGDAVELLPRVERGDFARPCQVDPAIDKALEAIVLKAMATRPEARYGSARALADDVEHWLADERVAAYPEPWTRRLTRWLTRHRTPVTGAAAALLVGLAGLGLVAAVQTRARADLDRKNGELTVANGKLTESNAALDLQKTRAEDREKQAIEAVKRFRDAVAENPRLKDDPELEDLRKALLREPLAFFRSLRERLQADRDTRPESLARLAGAIHEYAHLTAEVGDQEDGLKSHEDSLAIWRGLTRDEPDDPEYLHGLGRIENCRGNFLHTTGEVAGARQAYEAALATRERLAREHPTVTEYQRDLAESHNNLGELLGATGEVAGARQALEAALAIRERLARDHPTVTHYRSDLALSHGNLGNLLGATGEVAGARQALEAALAIRERLAREHPTVTGYQADLAHGHSSLGALLHTTGEAAGARQAYEAALAILERLALEHPTVTHYQGDLAASHHNLGVLLRETGDPAGARQAYDAALATRERLAREHPTLIQYQSDLAGSHLSLGNLLGDTGDPAGARQAYDAALVIQERLAREHPTVTRFQRDLARSHHNLGVLLGATGEPAGARAAYEAALAILERLARDHPTVTEYRSAMARSHHNLGALLSATGEVAGARRAYDAALAILERLAREHPTITQYQADLALSHNNLGVLLRETGDPAGARQAHEAALAIRERLAREHPESPDHASNLGGTLHNLAVFDLDAQRFAEARDRLREAITWQKKALAANPRKPQYRQFLTNHYTNLHVAARGLGDADLAAEAQSGLDELATSDPELKALDERLAAVLKGEAPKDIGERLALAQRAYDTKRYALAARLWAEAIAADPKVAADRQRQHPYNAACAASLAASGEGTDAPADEEAKVKLRQQALAWLQAELATCSKFLGNPRARPVIVQTLDHWKEDADLAGIRDASALARLPEEERGAWRALWEQVEALRKQAADAGP